MPNPIGRCLTQRPQASSYSNQQKAPRVGLANHHYSYFHLSIHLWRKEEEEEDKKIKKVKMMKKKEEERVSNLFLRN